MSPLDRSSLLSHLRADMAAFGDCLEGDLGRSVAACPGWDLAALATHLGRVHLWAVAALSSIDEPAYPPRPSTAPLATWYTASSATLLAELSARDPRQPCWSLWPPGVTEFWVRRQAIETAVHRWDAQTALGRAATIDVVLAADGVGEVVDVMFPRQVAMGRQADLAVALELRAASDAWVVGTGVDGRVTLTAEAPLLLLLLWKRLTLDDVLAAGGRLVGPRPVAERVLAAALTP